MNRFVSMHLFNGRQYNASMCPCIYGLHRYTSRLFTRQSTQKQYLLPYCVSLCATALVIAFPQFNMTHRSFLALWKRIKSFFMCKDMKPYCVVENKCLCHIIYWESNQYGGIENNQIEGLRNLKWLAIKAEFYTPSLNHKKVNSYWYCFKALGSAQTGRGHCVYF